MTQKLTYQSVGDYLIPNLRLTEIEPANLGKYGRIRRAFLCEHRPTLYNGLVLTDRLFPHLYEMDCIAHQRLERIEQQLLACNPAPDKATDQMAWLSHRITLKAQAEEQVLAEVVYE